MYKGKVQLIPIQLQPRTGREGDVYQLNRKLTAGLERAVGEYLRGIGVTRAKGIVYATHDGMRGVRGYEFTLRDGKTRVEDRVIQPHKSKKVIEDPTDQALLEMMGILNGRGFNLWLYKGTSSDLPEGERVVVSGMVNGSDRTQKLREIIETRTSN